MKLLDTPIGCNVTSLSGVWYKIGSFVFFSIDAVIGNNGTSTSININIPCLPFAPKRHVAFDVCYRQAVFKANGSDSNVALMAGAWGDSTNIYIGYDYDGRSWYATQKDLYSGSGSIVISGCYITSD